MEKELIKELIEKIKEKYPGKAEELAIKLNSVKKSLDNTAESIVKEMQEQIAERNFDITDLTNTVLHLEVTQEELNNVIFALNPDFEEKEENEVKTEEISEEDSEEANKKNKNYSDYEVDSSVEHFIDEPFTHRRPHGYRLLDQDLKECKTWKDIFVAICEDLLEIDENKFLNLENNDDFRGRSGKYFSVNIEEIKDPLNISDKIHAASIKSGESIRGLIIKMLQEFNIKTKDFKIYLKADYSDMN